MNERRRHLAVRPGKLLRSQEYQRLRVRVLRAMPDVRGDVAEVANSDIETHVLNKLLSAALDVELQRVAVRVVPLGSSGASRREHVEVVHVETKLRPHDDALIGAGVRDIGLCRRHVHAPNLTPLVQRQSGAPKVHLLLHIERVELLRRKLRKLLREHA